MSERMRLDEAMLYADPGPIKLNIVRAARTIIHQAEQIERLQKALSLTVVRSGPNPLTRFEHMYDSGELLPEDMEAPK